jgi:uncharacterized protein (DUF1810 family)
LLSVQGRTAQEIFGTPDELKLKSSATLFAMVAPADSCFEHVLDKYFDGTHDERTVRILNETH